MKKMIIFAAVAGLFILTSGIDKATAQDGGTIKVNVEGMRSGQGHLMWAVKPDINFMEMNYIKAGIVETGQTAFEITGLTVGEEVYLFIFHDENGNRIMDMKDSGMPAEGFVAGKGDTYIPSVTVSAERQEITVEMTYL